MSCLLSPPCTFTEVPLDEISVQWDGPAVGRKALAYPKSKRIFIDHGFWQSIPTVVGRAGLLAHERGHIEGAKCEPCADRRGGEILKREGWPTPRDAQVVAISRLENRDGEAAAKQFGEGFGADGFLQHRERAEGVCDELQGFLDLVGSAGVQYAGRTWPVMVGVNGGVRTTADQFTLFKKGRAAKPGTDASDWHNWSVVDQGQVVTEIATASGMHPKARAVDLWIVGVDGQPLLYPKDYASAGLASSRDFDGVYAALGQLGKAQGLRWGGDWGDSWSTLDELLAVQKRHTLIDRPHFETTGLIQTLVAAVAGEASTDEGPPPTPAAAGHDSSDDDTSAAVVAGVAVVAAFFLLAV